MLSVMPIRILLDCDPGHDDVVAIIAAAHYAELVGITTVAGNAPLDRTTYNACVMRDLLGLNAPVHAGAIRPLLAEPHPAAFVHGESGLDGADLPVPARGSDSDDAVGFIIDTCRAEEGLWLVPTGPLTNIALAMRAAPDLTERVAGVSLMGGGSFGNRSAVAEAIRWSPMSGSLRSTRSAGGWRRCWPICSASSPARTRAVTSTWLAPPCTTRWRCWH